MTLSNAARHQLVFERPNEKPLRYALSLPEGGNGASPLILSFHYAGHGRTVAVVLGRAE